MILLRRGRQTHPLEPSFEIDVMVDFRQASTRSRQQCLAPWRPPIDVFETGSGLVVRAELGGLATSEVQVLLSGDELMIRGERDVVGQVGHRVYHESRVRYGQFEAAVRLPFAVDVESATAQYADGFLSIDLPRLEATRLTTRQERGAG
jgi:HSP20 family protein